MNILPKKRWHVRTKDNIARVRKDEAEAARIEEEKKRKIQLAESEARINYLRKSKHSTEVTSEEPSSSTANSCRTNNGHINLFGNSADDVSTVVKENKEYLKEKKEEKEKYEKQIGYLTYLGQDTNEVLKLKSWYEVAPEKRQVDLEKIKNKIKKSDDPLEMFRPKVAKEKISSDVYDSFKKTKSTKINKKKSLEELRAERLKREQSEKIRQEMLIKKFDVTPETTTTNNASDLSTRNIKQKYNNQFNPWLARQNM